MRNRGLNKNGTARRLVKKWEPPLDNVGERLTVECPDCLQKLSVGVGGVKAALAGHRDRKPCQARRINAGAMSAGWVPLHDLADQSVEHDETPGEAELSALPFYQACRRAGVKIAWIKSLYYDGSPRTTPMDLDRLVRMGIWDEAWPIVRGQSKLVAVPWIPAWALQVWRDCLGNGDNVERALRAWVEAGANQGAGMLMDSRLLND